MSGNDPMIDDRDALERELFAALPREMAPIPGQVDRTLDALRAEGFLRSVRAVPVVRMLAAAAMVLVVALVGGLVGGRLAASSSLEAQIARDDLSVPERVLLLQRAGSAYVRAAHAYADATTRTDSTAIEVAQQVLRGAAHAVVRSHLDAGVAARLTTALQASQARPDPERPAPILWF